MTRRLRVRRLGRWLDAELIEERDGGDVVARVDGKRRLVRAKNVRWRTEPSVGGVVARPVYRGPSELRPVPRDVPARDPAYRAWLQGLPCDRCGAPPPSEVSHHGLRGVATKASDHEALPACHACHAHHHQTGRFPGTEAMTREEYREQLNARAKRYRRRYCKLRSEEEPTS